MSDSRQGDPPLTSLLRSRMGCAVVLVAGLGQCIVAFLGWPGWGCPLYDLFHIPCPGCGLSRSVSELLHGHFRRSVELHLYGLTVIPLLFLMMSSLALPEQLRERFLKLLALFERRTKVTAVLLIAFMAYWIIRLAVFREAFLEAVRR